MLLKNTSVIGTRNQLVMCVRLYKQQCLGDSHHLGRWSAACGGSMTLGHSTFMGGSGNGEAGGQHGSMEGSGVVDLCQHREGQGHSQAAARPHGVAGSPTSIASRPSAPALTQHTQQGRLLVGWLSARASAQPAGAGSSQDLSKGFRPPGQRLGCVPHPWSPPPRTQRPA